MPLSLHALSGIPGQPLLTALPGAFIAVHVQQLLTPAQARTLHWRDALLPAPVLHVLARQCRQHTSDDAGDGLPRHAVLIRAVPNVAQTQHSHLFTKTSASDLSHKAQNLAVRAHGLMPH